MEVAARRPGRRKWMKLSRQEVVVAWTRSCKQWVRLTFRWLSRPDLLTDWMRERVGCMKGDKMVSEFGA